MNRGRLFALITGCLVAACGVAAVMKGARERERHVQAMAQALGQRAAAEAPASTTAADAKAWLERNGFDVALYGDNPASEREEQTPEGLKTLNIVDGYRLLAPASAMRREHWVRVEFVFRATEERFVPGAFLGVEVHDDDPPTKALRAEFRRRRTATSQTPAAPGAR